MQNWDPRLELKSLKDFKGNWESEDRTRVYASRRWGRAAQELYGTQFTRQDLLNLFLLGQK